MGDDWLTSIKHTARNSHPRSRLMTLMAVRKVWNTGGNSIEVIAAYCVMIYSQIKKGKEGGEVIIITPWTALLRNNGAKWANQ